MSSCYPALSPPFSKSWKFSALRQLVGSELGVCLLGVFHYLGILIQDSLFNAQWLPVHCVFSLLVDCSLTRVSFNVHLFCWFCVVRVSLLNSRPNISGSFLTKLCLFFLFLLSLLVRPSVPFLQFHSSGIADNLSLQLKIFLFVSLETSFSLKVLFSGGVIYVESVDV